MTAPGTAAANRGPRQRARLVLVTGMSGAGKTIALKALEDIGYEALDNLPLSLLPAVIEPAARDSGAVAVDIDVRTRDFDADTFAARVAPLLARADIDARLLFVDCDDEMLRRRYTATRRRHPLAGDRPVIDGIRLERQAIEPLRGRADLVIDTTDLAEGELRRTVADTFALDDGPALRVFVTSFSYRHGLPRDADLVCDVRFLANPHYEPRLKPLTGLDAGVGDFIAADPGFEPFFASLTAMLLPLLPRYEGEGKSYLTIAVGCTGGRHRSVFVARRLTDLLADRGLWVRVRHRDLDRAAE